MSEDTNREHAPAAPVLPPPRPRRASNWLRIPLMTALPLALAVAGGWYWINGSRWASTENAYVQQNKVLITRGRNSSIRLSVPIKGRNSLCNCNQRSVSISTSTILMFSMCSVINWSIALMPGGGSLAGGFFRISRPSTISA